MGLVTAQNRASGTFFVYFAALLGIAYVVHVCVGAENSKLDLLQCKTMLLYGHRTLMLCSVLVLTH